MFNAKNLCLDRTLKLKGVELGPGESALIEGSAKDVKDHLFVKEGMIHVEGKGGRPSKSEKSGGEATESESAGAEQAEGGAE